MASKTSILFYNPDQAGVAYYRTLMPALRLQKDYPEEFYVEINQNVNWNDLEYLKKFNIIHGHRTLCDYAHMETLVNILHKEGIKVVIDVDDYWDVHEKHPVRHIIKNENLAAKIKNNLRIADYVTTTTEQFASYIRPINKNVVVIPNGVDDTESQFAPQPKVASDKVRVMWLGGSSHEVDIDLLTDSMQRINSDQDLRSKMQLHLVGFDLRGSHTEYAINEEFVRELYQRKIATPLLMSGLQKTNWNADAFPQIPQDIRDRYRGNIVVTNTRDVKPTETVWYRYEKVFTSDYKLISDKNYEAFLKSYNLSLQYPDQLVNQPYVRHATQNIHHFANAYRHADVCLAPIKVFNDKVSNCYQFAKSNLKAIEAGFHKVPLIASQVPTYTGDADFVDGKNILFVKPDRQEKDWFKKIKMLVNNPEMAKDLGEAAYELVSKKYSLKEITKTRKDFYQRIVE